MKYKYTGSLSAEIIDGKETILKNGSIYEFAKMTKRIETLIKRGYLMQITEKTKGQK